MSTQPPPLPSENQLSPITLPSQDISPKLTLLTRTDCPPELPTCLLPSVINLKFMQEVFCPQIEQWHWFSSACLSDILTCCPKKVPSPSLVWPFPHWPFPFSKGNKKKWLCYFTSQKMEDQIYEVCPNMRLNVEITLTSGNRIFTPKFGFERQLSHWVCHEDSAGLKTACSFLFSISIWKLWQYTIFSNIFSYKSNKAVKLL